MTVALLFSLLAAVFAPAAPLEQYLVFSRTTITGARSDYQGPAAARGAVRLEHFLVNGELSSAERIDLRHGSIHGIARAPRVNLVRATAQKRVVSGAAALELAEAEAELLRLSDGLAGLSATAEAEEGSATVEAIGGQLPVTGLRLRASAPRAVIDVSEEAFARAENLILVGGAGDRLVLRIYGNAPRFSGKGVFTEGGLRPEQVLYYFPEARDLSLAESGGAVDALSRESWGVPGALLAPFARVSFSRALLTGPLYAGALSYEGAGPSGQVNFARSWVLEELHEKGCDCAEEVPAPGV